MRKRRSHHKKGFTLVELIVVLVILAILLAILVPSLTGWITKSKRSSIIVRGRTALIAAQTLAATEYAKGWDPANPPTGEEILNMAGLSGDGVSVSATFTIPGSVDTTEEHKFSYTEGKFTAYYWDGEWVVEEGSGPTTTPETSSPTTAPTVGGFTINNLDAISETDRASVTDFFTNGWSHAENENNDNVIVPYTYKTFTVTESGKTTTYALVLADESMDNSEVRDAIDAAMGSSNIDNYLIYTNGTISSTATNAIKAALGTDSLPKNITYDCETGTITF